MGYALGSLEDLRAAGFDAIIDVRSPAEFAEDHIPGAINLPVLSNTERADVGTIYVQESRFKARKIGAALVARNAARHLEVSLADKDGSFRPLVYCWRGGQRSGSFATILQAVGWRVDVLQGGYQSWRRRVAAMLYGETFPGQIVLLDGNTGTAKTELLARLNARGAQVIDLEALAGHRGSLFGAQGPQPSQKMFEGRLADTLAAFDPRKPVILEAESSKIGERILPPALWSAMGAAPRIVLEAPLGARAAYLARTYADIVADQTRLNDVLSRLIPMQGHEQVSTWQRMGALGQYEKLAAALMSQHYDPRYAKQRGRRSASVIQNLTLKDLSDTGLDAAAGAILQTLQSI